MKNLPAVKEKKEEWGLQKAGKEENPLDKLFSYYEVLARHYPEQKQLSLCERAVQHYCGGYGEYGESAPHQLAEILNWYATDMQKAQRDFMQTEDSRERWYNYLKVNEAAGATIGVLGAGAVSAIVAGCYASSYPDDNGGKFLVLFLAGAIGGMVGGLFGGILGETFSPYTSRVVLAPFYFGGKWRFSSALAAKKKDLHAQYEKLLLEELQKEQEEEVKEEMQK